MKLMFGLAGCVLFFLWILLWPTESGAVQNFKLDGNFNDWQGRVFLTNELSDNYKDYGDRQIFKTFYWGTNENEQKLYFMVERYAPVDAGNSLTCRIYFDTNGNGSYEDGIDKFAEVLYRPNKEKSGELTVQLYSISGSLLAIYHGAQGEGPGNGARQFEFAVPMADLGIYPAQPIRFYLSGVGSNADRLPGQGDILWAPFPVTEKSRLNIAIGFLFWLVVTVFFRRHRIWVFYYIWGAVGFTFILILLLRGSLLEYQMIHRAGIILYQLLSYLGMDIHIFDRGTLLISIKIDNSWTAFDINFENSGLMEMCILLGLILFYPYNSTKKILFSLAGIISVYAINILCLIMVIAIIYWGGRNMIFIAHALLGRLFFFLLFIELYWQIFTKPSLKIVRKYIENA